VGSVHVSLKHHMVPTHPELERWCQPGAMLRLAEHQPQKREQKHIQ
jgi:hypothetical protein